MKRFPLWMALAIATSAGAQQPPVPQAPASAIQVTPQSPTLPPAPPPQGMPQPPVVQVPTPAAAPAPNPAMAAPPQGSVPPGQQAAPPQPQQVDPSLAPSVRMGGGMEVVARTCGGYTAQDLSALKEQRRALAKTQGVDNAAFEHLYTQGIQETAARFDAMNVQQRNEACEGIRVQRVAAPPPPAPPTGPNR